jgi:hypothetical protein
VERETIALTKGKSEVAASFEEFAASQGVLPVTDFEALLGHPSSEDESVEELSTMLRE